MAFTKWPFSFDMCYYQVDRVNDGVHGIDMVVESVVHSHLAS